jgi:hypothetical protein
MRRAPATLAILTAAAFAASAAPPAPAAEPQAGKRYDGGSKGRWGYAEVSRDGQRLARYDLSAHVRCSDGRRRLQGIWQKGETPVRIEDGRFAHSGVPMRVAHRFRGGKAYGRIVVRFRGHFIEEGTKIVGAIKSRFRGRRLRCSSDWMPYTLHLNGTRGAPYRNRHVATGVYAVDGRRMSRARMRVFLPAKIVEAFVVRWRARCTGGGGLRVSRADPSLLDGRRFRARGRARYRIEDGLRVRERYRLRGRLYNDGTYRVRGQLSVTSAVYRRGTRVAVCRTGRLPFRGTFREGPENL